MEGNTGRKGLGVWKETLAGRGWDFGGRHWQEGAETYERNTGRKRPEVWMETLTGRNREFGEKH